MGVNLSVETFVFLRKSSGIRTSTYIPCQVHMSRREHNTKDCVYTTKVHCLGLMDMYNIIMIGCKCVYALQNNADDIYES